MKKFYEESPKKETEKSKACDNYVIMSNVKRMLWTVFSQQA